MSIDISILPVQTPNRSSRVFDLPWKSQTACKDGSGSGNLDTITGMLEMNLPEKTVCPAENESLPVPGRKSVWRPGEGKSIAQMMLLGDRMIGVNLFNYYH
jgi:hypothetical protein